MGKARDVGRLQAASVVILDVVRRKRADEVVARSGRKRRQIEKIEDREEDIGEKYKSARTGEATPSSVKKTPMRTGEGPARRRLAEVRAAALAYDEEVQAASVAEEPAAPTTPPKQPTPHQPTPKQPTPHQPTPKEPTPKQPTPKPETPKEPTPQKQAPLYKVGDRVEGDFEGLGEFYAGVIGTINEDGTFLVNYDDGDEEDRYQDRLRKITAPTARRRRPEEPDIWRADDDHESVSDEPTQALGGDSASGLTSSQDYDDDFDGGARGRGGQGAL